MPKQPLGRDQHRLTCSRLAMADTYSASLDGIAPGLLLHNIPIKIFISVKFNRVNTRFGLGDAGIAQL